MRLRFINTIKTWRIPQKLSFYLWLLIGIICLFFLLLIRRYDSDTEHCSQHIFSQAEVEDILHQQRLKIKKEMAGYPYDAISRRNIRLLSDLIMERGGKPVRSVVVTSFRSGSSFFGDLVSAHPASFYYFEPLAGLGQFRTPLSSRKPLDRLESLFKCNFSKLGDYLEYRKTANWRPDDDNRYLKKQCRINENLCHDPEFSTRLCRLFPFQVMKIVALDLASMKSFLENKNLGVKIIFMVRDPRGVMNSRKDLPWCQITPYCLDSASLCSNMVSDYLTAMDFSKRYPESFKVLRYEDFTNDLWKVSQEIYSFYGINFHENVKKFIETHTHTKVSRGNPYNTARNSKAVTFQWKEKLTFNEVNKIQKNCYEAMNIWDYNLATNSNYQMTFNSVRPLSTGVKIVFLVRDTRGIMHSRKELDWCKNYQNCHNLTLVCFNAISDYVTAMHFSKRYPKSFKVLRYEDLTNHPWKLSKEIYSFYGMDFHETVKEFIDSHTHMDGPTDANPHSTFRNSKDAASQWKEKLTFDEVVRIQEHCHEALKMWGYNFATDSYHQKTFNPLIPLSTMNINYFQ